MCQCSVVTCFHCPQVANKNNSYCSFLFKRETLGKYWLLISKIIILDKCLEIYFLIFKEGPQNSQLQSRNITISFKTDIRNLPKIFMSENKL